jgi:hypothetical protein
MKKKILGIRRNKPPVILDSVQEAANLIGTKPSNVHNMIRYGTKSKNGWCFDYPLEFIDYGK